MPGGPGFGPRPVASRAFNVADIRISQGLGFELQAQLSARARNRLAIHLINVYRIAYVMI